MVTPPPQKTIIGKELYASGLYDASAFAFSKIDEHANPARFLFRSTITSFAIAIIFFSILRPQCCRVRLQNGLQSFSKHHFLALTPLCRAEVYRDKRFKANIRGTTWHSRNWEGRSEPHILSWKTRGFRLTAVKCKSMRIALVPVPGRGNFRREILIETIAENGVRQNIGERSSKIR